MVNQRPEARTRGAFSKTVERAGYQTQCLGDPQHLLDAFPIGRHAAAEDCAQKIARRPDGGGRGLPNDQGT